MSTKTTDTINQLRDLLARVETYGKRRAELEALKADLEARSDFTLGDSELGLYAQTAGGVQLAAALDKPMRATIAKDLRAAGSALGSAIGRVQNLHQQIDEEIRKRVAATLPPELEGVEVVTGTMHVTVQNAFEQKLAFPSKLHIKESRLGKAEFAARVDPLSAHAQGYFDPVAPLPKIVEILTQMMRAIEKVDVEEQRCLAVLARFQKQAA